MTDFCTECQNTIESCECQAQGAEPNIDDLVFEIDLLKKEVERLNDRLLEQFELNLKAVKKYEKALRKCSPFTRNFSQEYWDGCVFCDSEIIKKHEEGCEYIKLIGGTKDG